VNETSPVELLVNSAAYWDKRFTGDWSERGGPGQTKFFASILCDALPAWISSAMAGEKFSLLDIGCAFGEANEVFKPRFPGMIYTGVDISRVSIERAKHQYPQTKFRVVAPDWSGMPKADFVLASNTLEHLTDWMARLTIMCRLARRAAFVLVPCEEEVLDPEHVARFDERVFPIRQGTKRLAHLRVIDTASLPASRWNGNQILAIYVAPQFAGPRGEAQLGDITEGLDLRGLSDEDAVQVLMQQKPKDRTASREQPSPSQQDASTVSQVNAEWGAKFATASAEYKERHEALTAAHAQALREANDRLHSTVNEHQEYARTLIGARDTAIAAKEIAERRRDFDVEMNAARIAHLQDVARKELEMQLAMSELTSQKIRLSAEMKAEALAGDFARNEAQMVGLVANLKQLSNDRATLISEHALEIDRIRAEHEALAGRLLAQAASSEEARALVTTDRDALISSHIDEIGGLRAANEAKINDLLEQAAQSEDARLRLADERGVLIEAHAERVKELLLEEAHAEQTRQKLIVDRDALIAKHAAKISEMLAQAASSEDARLALTTERDALIASHDEEIGRSRAAHEAQISELTTKAARDSEARIQLVCERETMIAAHAAKINEFLVKEAQAEQAHMTLIGDREALIAEHSREVDRIDAAYIRRTDRLSSDHEARVNAPLAEVAEGETARLRLLAERDRLAAQHLHSTAELAGELERLRAGHANTVSALNALNIEQSNATYAAILENQQLRSEQEAVHADAQGQLQDMMVRIETLLRELAEARRETAQLRQAHRELLEGHETEMRRLHEDQAKAEAMWLDVQTTQKADFDALMASRQAAEVQKSVFERASAALRDHYERHLNDLNLHLDQNISEAKKMIGQLPPGSSARALKPGDGVTTDTSGDVATANRIRIEELLASLEYSRNVAGATDYYGNRNLTARAVSDLAEPAPPLQGALPVDSFVVAMQLETFDRGGLERVVYDLCCGLHAAGIRVLVLCRSGGILSDEIRAKGVSVFALRNDDYVGVLERNGVTHLFTHHSYFGFDIAARLGVKTFDVVHNTYFWQLKNPQIVHHAGQSSSCVICVSSNVRDFHVKAFGVPRSKTIVINNPVNLEGLLVPGVAQLRRIRSVQNQTVFLNVANHYPAKAQIAMVSAFGQAARSRPEIRLLIAGTPTTQSITNEINRMVQTQNLAEVVTVLGHCSRRRLGLLYAQSHAFLLPSIFEGYSVSALEAATYGLPLIMTNVGSAQDLVKANDCGILLPPIIEDLTQCTPDLVDAVSAQHENRTTPHLVDAITSIARDRSAWLERGFTGMSKAVSLESAVNSYITAMQDAHHQASS
jgi:glycosyltransferase involved in cell wall biosynthesis/SAM-dependent methyltransferase